MTLGSLFLGLFFFGRTGSNSTKLHFFHHLFLLLREILAPTLATSDFSGVLPWNPQANKNPTPQISQTKNPPRISCRKKKHHSLQTFADLPDLTHHLQHHGGIEQHFDLRPGHPDGGHIFKIGFGMGSWLGLTGVESGAQAGFCLKGIVVIFTPKMVNPLFDGHMFIPQHGEREICSETWLLFKFRVPNHHI